MNKLTNKKRCAWCQRDPLYINYHDKEWGVPIHDDKLLFEFLILEGMQAGLSWLTVLKKRVAFRAAFSNFNAHKIAKYDQKKIKSLMNNAGIIRNQLKINAVIANAKAFLAVKKEWGSFDKYIWHFVDGLQIHNRRKNIKQLPAKTDISDKMSKDLKKRGFKFVGSTICYSLMQAVGMVNDHIIDCYRYAELI